MSNPAQTIPGRILIIKPSALGDVVQTIAVASAIHAALPAAEIGWVVNAELAGLLDPVPGITRVHRFERDKMRGLTGIFRGRAHMSGLTSELRAANYELSIDFQGLIRSAWLGRTARAKTRWGFAEARELAPMFYTRRHTAPRGVHAVERYLSLASAAVNIPAEQLASLATTSLCSTPAERSAALDLMRSECAGAIRLAPVVLCPGARWISKQWPAAEWARLAVALARHRGEPTILVGSPAESGLCAHIAREAPGAAITLAGKTTLRILAALLAESALAVTNDSGPMHMASAQGTPLVALFGPTDPVLTGPWRRTECVIRSNTAPADPRAPCTSSARPCLVKCLQCYWRCRRD